MKKKIKSLDSSNIQYDQLKYNIQVTPSEKEEKIQVSLKFLKETASIYYDIGEGEKGIGLDDLKNAGDNTFVFEIQIPDTLKSDKSHELKIQIGKNKDTVYKAELKLIDDLETGDPATITSSNGGDDDKKDRKITLLIGLLETYGIKIPPEFEK